MGTRFAAPLRAILAQDRRPRGARGRPLRPVVFHAVGGGVRLLGYQDSRPAFVGGGSLRLPRALAGIDGLSFVHLGRGDVVRHRIVQDIVDPYERDQSRDRSGADGRDGSGERS